MNRNLKIAAAVIAVAVITSVLTVWNYSSQRNCPKIGALPQSLKYMETKNASGKVVVIFQSVNSLDELQKIASSEQVWLLNNQQISYGWIANLGYNAYYASGYYPVNPYAGVLFVYVYKCP